MRQAEQDWCRKIRDVGFLPEGERFRRAPGVSPYDLGHDDAKYPFERVFAMAERASMLKPEALPDLKKGLADSDSAVRYWAILGILMRGQKAYDAASAEVHAALKDPLPEVRVVAAQMLGQFGKADDLKLALTTLLELCDRSKNDVFASMNALIAVDTLGAKAAPIVGKIKALPNKGKVPDGRYAPYVPRLIEDLKAPK